MKALIFLIPLILLALTCPVRGDTFGAGGNTFNIAFVSIGNPGNAADNTGSPRPAGSVPYVYNIGKYEISRDMITKANNLGNLAITLADLTSTGGNGVDRPASGISWNEAARFVNWLNASTGSPLAYKFAFQPGDGGYSANADIQLWTPSDAGYNANNLYRNSLARYFMPSIDEWYKAAYYNPTSGFYSDYPTGTTVPIAPAPVASGTAANTAIYDHIGTGPADVTLAGGLSRYGTMGQGGNMYEWEETDYDLVNGPTPSSSERDIRGGSWNHDLMAMHVGFRLSNSPTNESILNGLRVASANVPEPSTLVLALSIFAPLATLRRRRG